MTLADAAKLCAATYADEAAIQAVYPQAQIINAPGDLRAVVVPGDLPVIAVRGTVVRDPLNWLTDADCRLVPTPDGLAHAGFVQAADALFERLPPGGEYLFTGHSLGGAVAAVLAVWWGATDLVTFGQPRTATQEFFAKSYLQRYTRVVNNRDPVACVPCAGRYHHSGECVWFDANGQVAPYPHGEQALNVLRLGSFLLTGDLPDAGHALACHHMAEYVRLTAAHGL